MGRPTTKADFLTAAAEGYEQLNALMAGLTEKELSTVFDFTGDEKKEGSALEKGSKSPGYFDSFI